MSLFSPSETWKERSLAICRWSAIATAIATPMSTAVSSIMTGIMMVAWLASGEVVRTVKVAAKQPAGKMLLIFMAWLVVGTLYAATPWIDRLITLISWKKLAITFILLGLFCDAYWKERFVKGYLVIMIVGLAISLFLWLMGMDFSPRRPAGIFMNNYATQSMAFLVAFIFCLFLWPNQESMKNKVLLAIVLVLFAFDILFVSVARSGYVAFFTALAFALCYLLGKKKIPYIIGFLVVVLGIVALTSANFRYRVERGLQERANYLQDERETQVGLRVVFYKNTVALITQRPIFGYGTSSFKSVYAPYAAQKYTGWRGGGDGRSSQPVSFCVVGEWAHRFGPLLGLHCNCPKTGGQTSPLRCNGGEFSYRYLRI